MKSSFDPHDLMVVLDGIDDAVVKLDGKARFVGMNLASSNRRSRPSFTTPETSGGMKPRATPFLLESSWCFETSPKEKMLLTRKGTAPCRGLIRSVQVS